MSDGPSGFGSEWDGWEQLSRDDHAAAVAFVRRAKTMVMAFSQARAAGHGDTAILEIAGTLRVSQRTAERLLGTAMVLVAQPRVTAAVEAGQLGQYHAFALVNALVGEPVKFSV